MWVAFANAKATHIFFSKDISIYAIFNDQSFNDTFTNDVISFEQLGTECPEFWTKCKWRYSGNAAVTMHSHLEAPKEGEMRTNKDNTNATYETTDTQRLTSFQSFGMWRRRLA